MQKLSRMILILLLLFCFNAFANEILINQAASELKVSEVLKIKEKSFDISKINVDKNIDKIKESRAKHDSNIFASKLKCFYEPDIILGYIELPILLPATGACFYKTITNFDKSDVKIFGSFACCLLIGVDYFFIKILQHGLQGKKILNNLKSAYALKKLTKI
ncbi:hypothetical protein M1446_04910 [Candidatus Dependentiae bacterium]|nr:hypothetical protein [Candidatus Dependentiae bacterium]